MEICLKPPTRSNIGNPSNRVRTRSFRRNIFNNLVFISQIKLGDLDDAIGDKNWIMAKKKKKLNQFEKKMGGGGGVGS